MKISDLSVVQNLIREMEKCKKQIQIIRSGSFKLRDNYGEVLDLVPRDMLEVDSPVQILLLNRMIKELDAIERRLESLGVRGG